MNKETLIEKLLNEKAEKNNTIDLIAYALGLDAMYEALVLYDVIQRSEQLFCTLPIHGVMGSFIKELNWIDEPKKKASDIYKVMANAEVPMPHTVGNACIEITEQTYPYTYYKATLWCFNRGTGIAEARSVIDCKKKAFEWWSNFVCGFLNCP